jgi:alkyl sulfatase BDS1-like metallo-beta-lactamase superfamily hydrolase
VRINPERALASPLKLNLRLSDMGESYLITIENGVMITEAGVSEPNANGTATMTRRDLLAALFAGVALPALKISTEGDGAVFGKLAAMIDPLDANFNIVTP